MRLVLAVPSVLIGWVCVLHTLQGTPQSFVCAAKVRLSREEEPQAGPGKIPCWRGREAGTGLRCWGLCWGSAAPSLARFYPGDPSRLRFGARPSEHAAGTAQGSRGAGAEPGVAAGRQRVLSGCAGVCTLRVSFITSSLSPVLSCTAVQLEGCVFPLQPHPLANNPLVVLGACLSVSDQMPGGAFAAPRARARCVLVLISASKSLRDRQSLKLNC